MSALQQTLIELNQQPDTTSRKTAFDRDDLIECANGRLFGEGNAQLPLPPLLMFDRITHIDDNGGEFGKGSVTAQLDINPFLWFFKSHFHGDPLMPGCLCMEALWQLTGFYLGWRGYPGKGRIVDSGSMRFFKQVESGNAVLEYRLDIKRIFDRKSVIAISNGTLSLDGDEVSRAENIKVGLFKGNEPV